MGNYAWEFFWGTGKTIKLAREAINEAKRSRDWTGINWTGESSTLSGADGVAWPGMGIGNPQKTNRHKQKQEIADFYQRLSYELGAAFIETAKLPDQSAEKIKEYGEAFVDPDEELSIPELIKRLITHMAIANQIVINLKEPIDKSCDSPLRIFAEKLRPHNDTDIVRIQVFDWGIREGMKKSQQWADRASRKKAIALLP